MKKNSCISLSFNQLAIFCFATLTLATGCLQGLGEPPVRVGVTKLEFISPVVLVPKWSLFEGGMASHLKKPVSFDLMTPRQIRVHLGSGRLKFAMLSPGDYAEIAKAENCKILAIPQNKNGAIYRQGLIIVSAKSSIKSLSEVKSKRFHFMPRNNIINKLAIGALMDAGVASADLDKGILGLELDTHHINSLEVAKSVAFENDAAGVIDEADYRKWPEKGGNLLLLSPSKDQVRVIAKTIRVPEGPFVASIHTQQETIEKVRDYLLNVLNKKENNIILEPMQYSGFAEPIEPEEYDAYFELHRKLYPSQPESTPLETAPADSPAQP